MTCKEQLRSCQITTCDALGSYCFLVTLKLPGTSNEQTFLYLGTFQPFERKFKFVSLFQTSSVFWDCRGWPTVSGPSSHLFAQNDWLLVASNLPSGPVPCLAVGPLMFSSSTWKISLQLLRKPSSRNNPILLNQAKQFLGIFRCGCAPTRISISISILGTRECPIGTKVMGWVGCKGGSVHCTATQDVSNLKVF